jgi:ketosteroid isomerase-like protein
MSVAFVQSIYAAFGRGDVAAILAACQPDVVWHDVGRPADFPTFGPRHGLEAVQDFFGLLAVELEFQDFAPKSFHDAGDTVFVMGRSRLLVRRTGRTIETGWVHVFTLKDGKLAAFAEYADTAQFADAFRTA